MLASVFIFITACMGVHGTNNKMVGLSRCLFSISAFGAGSHKHATWNPIVVGKQLSFPTAEEAEYPIILCHRMETVLVQHAVAHAAQLPQTMDEQVPTSTNTARKCIMDMLPKGRNYVL